MLPKKMCFRMPSISSMFRCMTEQTVAASSFTAFGSAASEREYWVTGIGSR